MTTAPLTEEEYNRINESIKYMEQRYYNAMIKLLRSKYGNSTYPIDNALVKERINTEYINKRAARAYKFNTEFRDYKNSNNASKQKLYQDANAASISFNTVRPGYNPIFSQYWKIRQNKEKKTPYTNSYLAAERWQEPHVTKGGTKSPKKCQTRRIRRKSVKNRH